MILFDIKTSERNIHNEVFLESRKKLTMVMTRTPKLNKNNTHTQIHIYIYIYTRIYIYLYSIEPERFTDLRTPILNLN